MNILLYICYFGGKTGKFLIYFSGVDDMRLEDGSSCTSLQSSITIQDRINTADHEPAFRKTNIIEDVRDK